ncbi:LysM peptidoglycan-binding domain-containing protein [Yoonia sp. MH D7]
MIRSVVALFVFAVFLCGYIVLRQNDNSRPNRMETAAVTRAQTDSNLGPLPDALGTSLATLPAAPPTYTPVDITEMSQTTANVLAGLGVTVAAPAAPENTDPMFEMTAGVLSSIGAITGKTITTGAKPASPQSALELLVLKALQAGQSDIYIDSIVNEAAEAGTINVPQGLATSDGRVDTSVLLHSIITQAQIAVGGAAPAVPEVVSGEGTSVVIRTIQNATGPTEERIYTVGRGDSLGSIAIKFYGNVDKSGLIYDMNRAALANPNAIQVGQQLVIPAL